MTRIKFFTVLILLLACATLATRGTPDPDVSLASVVDLWKDTLRDTDQIGMKFTRASDAEESKLGEELARGFTTSASDPAAAYVTQVAQPLLAHVRRHGIHYQFHIVDSPEVNAFALPGGQIFVMRGMLEFVNSEAELAAVLGHEISHVDLRHCIEHYQYELKLRKAGMAETGWMVEMAHRLATFGFSSDQEAEADAQGVRLSIESEYDPNAGAALFLRMMAHYHEPGRQQATTPAGEASQAVNEGLGAFFRSHPPSDERSRRMHDQVEQNRSTLAGRSFYIGKRNLEERKARSAREYPDEFFAF